MQLNAVRAELSDLLSRSSETQRQLDESTQQVQQLRDMNALLKAQKGTCGSPCIIFLSIGSYHFNITKLTSCRSQF